MAEKPLTTAEANKIRNDYNFILGLAANDTTGSMIKFWQDLRKVIKDSNGDKRIITAYVDRELPKQEYFMSMYGAQAQAAIDEARPEFAADVERAVDIKRQSINAIAERYGIQFPEGSSVDDFAREAYRNGWDNNEILLNMRPYLAGTLESGDRLTGTAGGFRDDLMQWARRNGISLDNATANKYISNMTLGSQDIESVKQDIRETYLVGAYPAWSDRIRAGFDPEQIAKPYKAKAADLLELDEDQIDLNDIVMQRAMQGISSDGKPTVVPLYDFERQVREDPRWQYTDNARKTYSTMADDLLKMFGFR